MTSRPNDVSPLHIGDIWGKLEELENDIELLQSHARNQAERIDLLMMIIKAKWPEKQE